MSVFVNNSHSLALACRPYFQPFNNMSIFGVFVNANSCVLLLGILKGICNFYRIPR